MTPKIEVSFYHGQYSCGCDLCNQKTLLLISGYTKHGAIRSLWLCADHVKELLQLIDPLRVLVLTGKGVL